MLTRTFANSYLALLLVQIPIIPLLYSCPRAQRLLAAPISQTQNAATACYGQSACFELALSLARLHQYRAAAAALRQVQFPEEKDQQIAFYRLRAAIAEGTGDSQSAARDMEQALRLAPGDPNLIISTGIAEVKAQSPERAIQLLQPVFGRQPEALPGLWLLRAQLALKRNPEPTLRSLQMIPMPADERVAWHLALGTTLAEGGLHQLAAREFQTAAALEPRRPAILYDLALEQYQSGELGAALSTTDEVKALHDSAALETLKGEIEEARADYLNAVHCYQHAVALAPEEEKYRLFLGYEFLKHRSYEPALLVFRQAAGLFPASVRARVALGMTYFFLQRYKEASSTLIQAVGLDRKSDFALSYLGITQQEQPDPVSPAAITAICGRAASNARSRVATTYCGALSFRKAYEADDKSQSQRILRQLADAATLSPKDPVANCEFGKALEWLGQWPTARTQMEKCVRLQPDSPDNHYRLARIDQHLGLLGLARQQFNLQEAARRKMATQIAHRDATIKAFLYRLRTTDSSGGQAVRSPSPEINGGSYHSGSTQP
jgi:tetratricopeptide (TPR) repeat protein